MEVLISIIAMAALYAGYKGAPFLIVLLVGAALTLWNLKYFGWWKMKVATGGPISYLLITWIFGSVTGAVLYGAGALVKILIG